MLPVLFMGSLRRVRSLDLADVCFCGYALMVILWPWYRGDRLWVPVPPLMYGYLADGIAGWGRLAREFPRLARFKLFISLDRVAGRFRDRIAIWAPATILIAGIGVRSCDVVKM